MTDDDLPLSSVRRELDALALLRDDLELRAHLGGADLRTQLHHLRRRWELIDEQFERVRAHVARELAMLRRELHTLVGDLREGFEDVRRALEN